MNVDLTKEERAFQLEVREFFRHEYPQPVLRKQERHEKLRKEDFVAGQRALHGKGWAGINWPVEYGGTGWTSTQKHLFQTEMAAANAPGIIPFGLSMVGPVIYTFGNDEQKQRFLPDILASKIWWCQGYSEPGSGSDLASLKCKAELAGKEYVVNGTKTWTTLAQYADWIFCLVRTNSDVARRQEGISFLLVDMRSPGVSVRPIITIEGEHEVNEVHLENVRVPAENLVGEEGRGWTYGKFLLTHERTGIAMVAQSKQRLAALKDELSSISASPMRDALNRKIAAIEIELLALEYTELRTLAAINTGGAPGPESSILKIKGTEIQQAIDTLFLEAAGYHAFPHVPEEFEVDFEGERIGGLWAASTAPRYFNNRKASIYGGSNEIQKNIIAKAVLGL